MFYFVILLTNNYVIAIISSIRFHLKLSATVFIEDIYYSFPLPTARYNKIKCKFSCAGYNKNDK